jgi:hypothetical protein
MARQPGLWDFVRAAFNAKPIGMFVAPNWIGLAAFGLLGLVNPGFWALGAGLELGYLSLLATNPRFQRTVAASETSDAQRNWQARVEALLAHLDEKDRTRYASLQRRCQAVLAAHAGDPGWSAGFDTHADSLSRVAWIYLRLLVTRHSLAQVLRESDVSQEEVRELRARLDRDNLTEDLRRSLQGQIDILEQRLAKRREAREKLAFLEAELTRIEQQVELVREQAALASDPQSLSQRIDEITGTLDGTAQWVRDQQQIYGAMDDLLMEPPPLQPRAKELQ